MGIPWKHPFSAPSKSHHSSHPPSATASAPCSDTTASLSSLLRSSSRKDPCNRLYRKAALLPDSSTAAPSVPAMTYPPSAPYRRDAEGRASRSASSIPPSAAPAPAKNTAMPASSGAARYVDYNDISDDDNDAHLRSPVSANSHAVQDAAAQQRQTQQRLSSTAPGPEHWVPGPHSMSSGGVRGGPPTGSGAASSAGARSRPPSFSGGRSDELALAGTNSGTPSSSQPPGSRQSQRPAQPAPSGGAHKRTQNSRSPPERRGGQNSSTHNGGPPPAMLNERNGPIQRLPTPSVAASVLHPLEQKVTEYASLMREAEDQVDQLDDQIRALQERRAVAESRYMEAKARHDEYRSQHADVERALRGDLPPLTPMLPPIPQGQLAGGGARLGVNPQQQQQQRGGMQQHPSMGSLQDQYQYEHDRPPQDNMNGMNSRRQSAQYNRPMSSSSAGDSQRNGSYGPDGKKGKGRFRFSLFG
ncbi:chromosome segregation protein [Microdochium nivale]|nr:chromosome segregation protein [Microdochium nivale]